MNTKSRRQFIKQSAGMALTLPVLTGFKINYQEDQYPKILFRLGWDSDNNDDMAVIPALYRLSQKTILGCEFYLWLNDVNPELLEMLEKNFTSLKIITGDIDESGQPDTDELKSILSEIDLFFYSTGAEHNVNWSGIGNNGIETHSIQYCFDNGIPYAILGLGQIPEDKNSIDRLLKLTNSAKFVYNTSSSTNVQLKESDIKIPKLQELPNPLFVFNLRDDNQSRKILEEYKLLNNNFLTIDFRKQDLSEDKIKEYGAKIVHLITKWVEESGKQVLILPNDPADIEVTLNHIYKPLSSQIKEKVFFHQEKLRPDTAASIYEKARIVAGMSLFPVCSAIQSGIPVFFLTSMDLSASAKTIEDMGLKNSIQELDSRTAEELSDVLLAINSKYVNGIIESDKAREYAVKKFAAQFDNINKFISKAADKKTETKKKDKKKKEK